ncbi:hypothetical protein [Methylobacterium dankookense]|uniref:Uncharacterized protein n=1 Tax=Methylobacterium dankookense TaxID=560405 RepID=A0A564G609_9HYPH|nr:hypothetical protein [Methylobacterium dankookense]GJD57655.1 hypothetical protein IFDJLNFL_3562 [Methylobacterium dankookense]VUF15995.1 hypothetical protein MTDSW087_05744 [Methylobacterium dankookense]
MSNADPVADFKAGMLGVDTSKHSFTQAEIETKMQEILSEFFAGINNFNGEAQQRSPAFKVMLHKQDGKNDPVKLRCTLVAYDAAQLRFMTVRRQHS